MNTNFGKIKDKSIEYAPISFKIGTIFYSNPTEQQYLDAGWKKIVNERLEDKSGYAVTFTKFTEDETHIYFNYEYKEIETTSEDFEISKFYLKVALIKAGLWDKVVEWMQGMDIDLGNGNMINCFDAYNDVLVLNTSNEFFKPYLEKAKEAFKDYISSDDIDKLLKSCEAK